MSPWIQVEPWLMVLSHVAACALSVWLGGELTARTLAGLRGKQASVGETLPARGFPRGAGQVIGQAERFLAYVTVLAGAWTILSVLVVLKTIIRYPEVRVDARRRELRFAEYYLVGTLVSLSVGIGVPLVATALVGSPFAGLAPSP